MLTLSCTSKSTFPSKTGRLHGIFAKLLLFGNFGRKPHRNVLRARFDKCHPIKTALVEENHLLLQTQILVKA